MSVPLRRNDVCIDVTLIACHGYESLYAVSSDGRVWSYPKQKRSWGIWLRNGMNSCGYHSVSLRDIHGSARSTTVHRLVAIAFLGKPSDESMQVNHKNGIKTDNRAENLEWCTGAENVRHAYMNNLINTRSPKRLAHSKKTAAIGRATRANNQRSQTHCKHGHELSGDNLRLYDGKRQCRACSRRFSRESYLAKKAVI